MADLGAIGALSNALSFFPAPRAFVPLYGDWSRPIPERVFALARGFVPFDLGAYVTTNLAWGSSPWTRFTHLQPWTTVRDTTALPYLAQGLSFDNRAGLATDTLAFALGRCFFNLDRTNNPLSFVLTSNQGKRATAYAEDLINFGGKVECAEMPEVEVVVFGWQSRQLYGRIAPAEDGSWSTALPAGSYGLSYLANGFAPISHGPYHFSL